MAKWLIVRGGEKYILSLAYKIIQDHCNSWKSHGARLSLPNSRVRPVDLRSMRWTCRGWRLSTSPVRCCFIGMNMNQTMKIHLGPLQRNVHLIVPWGLWDMGGGIHGIRDWKPGRQPWPLTIYPVGKRKTMLSGLGNPGLGMQLKNLKLLIQEIPNNHLGCTKPVVNNGISTISTG